MSFLKILVPVSGGVRDAAVLQTAFAVAKPFAGHVQALFVRIDPTEALPFGELPLSPDFAQELIDAAADVELVAANAARRTLAETAAQAGVKLVGAPQACDTASTSYLEITGYLPQVLAKIARLCDLVVFPEIRENDAHDIPDGLSRVLVKAACPALLAGAAPLPTFGRKIAIGWDDGVACARAMVTALPFLKKAETVELLSIRDKAAGDGDLDEPAAYLSLHGLQAARHTIPRGGRKVAETLLDTAKADGCDLLVIGGYSRGRMTEAMFGGVTEYVVLHAPLPIFMVH